MRLSMVVKSGLEPGMPERVFVLMANDTPIGVTTSEDDANRWYGTEPCDGVGGYNSAVIYRHYKEVPFGRLKKT